MQSRILVSIRKGVGKLTADPYLTSPGPYFLAEHLSSQVEITSPYSPKRERVGGNELAEDAVATMSVNVGVAIAFLLGAIAQAYRRGQRWLILSGGLVLLGSLTAFYLVGFGS